MKPCFIVFLTFLLLVSCANPEKDWRLAERDDSQNAYLEFLAKHPNSVFADLARKRIDELKIIRAWERAEFKDTQAAYQAFIDKYAYSEYATAATVRKREIQRDEHWERISVDGKREEIEAFLEEYPEAPQLTEAQSILTVIAEAEEAARPKERSGIFRLQLAAFKTLTAAEQERQRLVALAPEILLGPVRIDPPDQDNGSKMFLLKSVPMTGAEARNGCTELKKLGQVCIIINR